MSKTLTGLTEAQTAELDKPLPAEAVKQRKLKPGSNVMLSYIEGHYAIRTANRIFGCAGWRRETQEMRCVFDGEREGQRGTFFQASYVARIKVSVQTGEGWLETDGWGYGEGIDYNNPGQAHESAVKEAETDAMKRALVKFGDQFGLSLYDAKRPNVEEEPEGKAEPAPRPSTVEEGKYNFAPCPECGGELRVRAGRNGDFVGCSNYPKCKYTTQIEKAPLAGAADYDPAPGDPQPAPAETVANWIQLNAWIARQGVVESEEQKALREEACHVAFGLIPKGVDMQAADWRKLQDTITGILQDAE